RPGKLEYGTNVLTCYISSEHITSLRNHHEPTDGKVHRQHKPVFWAKPYLCPSKREYGTNVFACYISSEYITSLRNHHDPTASARDVVQCHHKPVFRVGPYLFPAKLEYGLERFVNHDTGAKDLAFLSNYGKYASLGIIVVDRYHKPIFWVKPYLCP